MSEKNRMTPPAARFAVPHPYLALMGLYLGGFTGMYSETALNIALPQLSGAFGVDLALTQWLVVGYMLVIGIAMPFSSLLTRWFSARKITIFALGAFLVGALMSGLAPSFPVALVGRAVQGLGTGLILPLMFAMVLEVIPPQKIGAAMGINALVIMSASAVGPTLAGVLIAAFSWRDIFFSFALILVAALALAVAFCPSPYRLSKPPVDVLSVATSVLGFGGIVLGFGMSSLTGWGSVPVIASLVVGAVALVVYCRRQLSSKAPVINLRVFKHHGFTIGALCVMLNFGLTLVVMYLLPQFYQSALLVAVALTGIIMLPGGIVNAFVSAIAGRIYDRIGARILALLGFGLSIIGCVMLLQTTPGTPLAYVVACHIVMMVGIPLAMSPCQTHALSSLPPELSTDGSALINTMQQVFGAICTALATYLLSTGEGAYYAARGQQAAKAFTAGSHVGFVFALVLAAVAFAIATRFTARRRAAAPSPELAANEA
ncbi:MAG: DHA2 family efflux MFS transporter permease subunit [Eggerthellaceae bacterium]